MHSFTSMNTGRAFHCGVGSLTLLASLLLLVLATGCTTVVRNPKAAFAGYATAEPIALKVGLNVTTNLSKPEFNKDGLVIRPGGYLVTNALLLTQHVFREVQMTTNAESASIDVLLTPKLVYVNRT